VFKLSDSHNHIPYKSVIKSIYNTYCFEDILNINRVTNPNIFIGIHPGYINDNVNFDIIESILKKDVINIGEIGLDKNYPDKPLQLLIFNKFLELGLKYNKKLVIHCIKSWGIITEQLNKRFNRDIPHMFHGYSGSCETMKELLKGNVYFSFSARELKRVKVIHTIKSIPIENLLIESDLMLDKYNFIGKDDYLNILYNNFSLLAQIKEMQLDDVIEIVSNNFDRFIKE